MFFFLLILLTFSSEILCGNLVYGINGVQLMRDAYQTETITSFGWNATQALHMLVASAESFLKNSPYSYTYTFKDYTFDYTLSATQPVPHRYNFPFW